MTRYITDALALASLLFVVGVMVMFAALMMGGLP